MSAEAESPILTPETREAVDPTKLVISPPLAMEIGLNESMMLRQLGFLIKVRPH